MNQVKTKFIASIAAATLILLAGCASAPALVTVPKVEPPPPEPKTGVKDDTFISFKRIILGNGGALYIAPDTAFESYDNWIVDQAGIQFLPEQPSLQAAGQGEL